MKRRAPDNCPNCGADLEPSAKACPECGSDHETGWSDEAYTTDLDLPDKNFDYDEFVEKEFGTPRKVKPHGLPWFWWVIAVVLLGAIVFGSIRAFL